MAPAVADHQAAPKASERHLQEHPMGPLNATVLTMDEAATSLRRVT